MTRRRTPKVHESRKEQSEALADNVTDGSALTLYRRERPQLLLGADGAVKCTSAQPCKATSGDACHSYEMAHATGGGADAAGSAGAAGV